jgi:hypothetical protein
MKEVSSRADGAIQLVMTRRMVSGSVLSGILSATNFGRHFRSVLGFDSLTDANNMCTFNKLEITSKAVVPAVYVISIVVCTGCIDGVKHQLHSLCRFFVPSSAVSTNSKKLLAELIMRVG